MNTKKTNRVNLLAFVIVLIFHSTCHASFGSTSTSNDCEDAGRSWEIGNIFSFFSSDNNKHDSHVSNTSFKIKIEKQIPSPQKANTPFPIKILSSKETTYTRIHLHSELGHVTPAHVDIKNGQWNGEISISEIGKNNRIEIHWHDEIERAGISTANTFDVTDNTNKMPYDATLTGKITYNNNNPINEATISIIDINTKQLLSSQETKSNGEYAFNNVQPGAYYLEVKTGNRRTTKKTKLASKRTITENFKLACDSNSDAKVPIILLPGIMGSYSKEKSYWLWPYPTLPPTPPAWNSGELAALDPFGYVGWDSMAKTLVSLGYVKGRTVFTVPYDWSLSIPVISNKYLAPWIKYIKQISGSDRVDIIAHSMGGLVARSYIQSENYTGDVRKFAMLGTPNKGANSVYYIWESGDPMTLDKAYGTPTIWSPTAYFYTNTLASFYRDRLHSDACKFSDIRRFEPLSCNKNKIYDGLHKKALSSGQLIPVYENALLKSGATHEVLPIIKEENTFLKALNNMPCFNPKGCVNTHGELYTYTDPKLVYTPNDSGVQTMIFRGTDNETVGSIIVEPQPEDYAGKTNKDGIPQSMDVPEKGDGTVLAKSVDLNDYLDPKAHLEIKEKNCMHSYLVAEFIPELVEFITGITISPSQIIAPDRENLTISTLGKVQIASIAANGMPIPQENIMLHDHKIGASGIGLKAPSSGNYTVSFTSPYNESYELSISYYDKNEKKLSTQKHLGYFDKSLAAFDFNLNLNAPDEPITFSRSFQTPTDLDIFNSDDKIDLTWQDTNTDVASYELFWKKDSEHFFKYLGTTGTNSKTYLTNHSWEDRHANIYVVRAILSNGKSTFLSQPTFHIEQPE